MLKKPINQLTEVLYLLIVNKRTGLSRKDFMNLASVLNAPDRIMQLRKHNVSIITEEKKTVNKFGRDIKFCIYKLKDTEKATEIYNKLIKSKQND